MTKQEKEQLQYLLLQYLEGRATNSERERLSRLLTAEKDDAVWEDIMEELMSAEMAMPGYQPAEWQPMIDALIARNKRPSFHLRSILRMVAAAVIILALGLSSYLLFFNKKEKQPEVAQVTNEVKAPETNRAVIILANGQKIYLDSAGNGQLATQANVKLVKLQNGKIVYSKEQDAAGEAVQYNTLSNPRGSRVIDMVLADGSHIWLNAGSSVTYPVAFAGKERKVTITGEAYFEVTKNAAMPFRVNVANKSEIEVLGTSFNVNAYDNEATVSTTLIDGSVKIAESILKPGQQAQIKNTGQVNVVNDVDLSQVMAWKNGLFDFNGMGLQQAMRQIERWYDIDVVYEEGVPNITFAGKITRNVSLKGLLIGLEKSELHFRLEGRKLIVLP